MTDGIYTSMHEEDVTDDMYLAVINETAVNRDWFKHNMYMGLGDPGNPIAWRYMRHDGEVHGTYGVWFQDEEEAMVFMLKLGQ